MNLMDLAVRITAKDEASKHVNSVAGSMSGALASAAKIAGAAIASAFAIDKIVDFGKSIVNAYATFEQVSAGAKDVFDEINPARIEKDANNAWKSMGMSANAYYQMLTSVGASFAASMGDEKAYETAKRGMTAIADYAAGSGKSIDLLTEKFQMISRSTSVYQSIADQFSGILPQTSKDFLNQAQAAGLLSKEYKNLTDVPVDEYQTALIGMLEIGTEKMNWHGQQAKESLGTIEGSLNATRTSWENLQVAMARGQGVEEATNIFMSNLENLAKQVAKRIGIVAKSIGEQLPGMLKEAASHLPDAIDTICKDIDDYFGTNISEMSFGDKFAEQMEKFQKNSERLRTSMSYFETPFKKITANVLPPFLVILESAGSMLGFLGEKFTELAVDISPQLAETLTSLGEFAGPILENFAEGFSIAMDGIKIAVDLVWPYVTEIINSSLQTIEGVLEIATGIMTGDWDTFVAGLSDIIDAKFPGMTTIISGYIDMIQGAFNVAKGVITGDWDLCMQGVNQISDAQLKITNATVDEKSGSMTTAIKNAADGVKTNWGDSMDQVKSDTAEGMAGAQRGMEEGSGKCQGVAQKLPGRIKEALGDVGSLLTSQGSTIVGSLIKGMQSRLRELTQLASKIGKLIQDNKGPIEYDRVMLVPQGKAIMEGLMRGMEQGYYSDVEGFVKGVAPDIQSNFTTEESYSASSGENVTEWLSRNLPVIISQCTPVMGERDFARMARKAVAYA